MALTPRYNSRPPALLLLVMLTPVFYHEGGQGTMTMALTPLSEIHPIVAATSFHAMPRMNRRRKIVRVRASLMVPM